MQKVLIANRGEIALRIHRACKEMGLKTVAVHSTADADAMHVRLADESVCIGPAPSRNSYMNVQSILSAASITGADAIHPGMGFLSENGNFARMVEEHGITFIGPRPEDIDIMGDKIQAKLTAQKLGLPVVPGSDGPIDTVEKAIQTAKDIGFPVIMKAASGGGGKGMRVAHDVADIESFFSIAQNEAEANFGDRTLYMEKYLSNPRHIEIQIVCDSHGHAIHLGERDCSIQRRHQKVWEEATSPVITPEQRADIGGRVARAMEIMNYRGVGTVEFLYQDGAFYFIEMNTRLQVEHPITEMITGVDIVREQIRVAMGEKLSLTQNDIVFKGHAIECRINAENPTTFIPSPGKILSYHAPGGPGVRVDSALYGGYSVPPHYDSLVSKLIVHDVSREACLRRLAHVLDEYIIDGIETTLPLHRRLATNPDVMAGEYTVHWLENFLKQTN